MINDRNINLGTGLVGLYLLFKGPKNRTSVTGIVGSRGGRKSRENERKRLH